MSTMLDILYRMRLRNEVPCEFIDVGAHFGETYDAIKTVFPDRNVLSFEANPNCAPVLQSRGIGHTICLLGRKHKDNVPFLLDRNDHTSTGSSMHKELTSTYFDDAETILLPMHRLDDVITVASTCPPDLFLKIDVQGAELEVIDGATDLLPHIRWIYLEVSFVPCNEGCPIFSDVFKKLTDLGYKISDFGDSTYIGNQLIQSNFLFIKI